MISFTQVSNCVELNRAIISLFKVNPRRADVQELLSMNAKQISPINAVTLMHRSSKIGKDVRLFLNESSILAFLDPSINDPLDAMGICNCLYGLKNFDDKQTFTSKVIIRLIAQIDRQKYGQITPLGISNSLYGMKSFSWKNKHSLRLLEALKSFILRSYAANGTDNNTPALKFTPQTLSNAFLGLQSLPTSYRIKAWYMQLLERSLDHLEEPFDAFSVANILLGLKVCDSKYIPARNALRKVAQLCQEQPEILYGLDSKKLSMSIWGLQGMRSEQPEVKQLLSAFNIRIEEIMLSRNRTRIEALKFQSTEEVGLLLGGMRGMSSDVSEVRRFLYNTKRLMQMPLAYSPKLKRKLRRQGKYWIYEKREEKFLASAFHGMQRMDDSHAEVRAVVQELLHAMQLDLRDAADSGVEKAIWSFGNVSTALYGLQSMSGSSTEVKQAVKVLTYLIDRNDTRPASPQEIAMAFYSLNKMSLAEVSDIPRLLKILTQKTKRSVNRFELRETAIAVYGLRNLDGRWVVVRDALDTFTGILYRHNQLHNRAGSSQKNRGLDAGKRMCKSSTITALLAMERMSYTSHSVRKFIEQLAPHVERCEDTFQPSELAVMFRSLRSIGCYSDVKKMRSMIATNEDVFREQLQDSLVTWNATNMRFRKVFVVPTSIQPLLVALLTKLKQRKAPLSASMVCSALYGLQGFTAEDRIVLLMVQTLADDLTVSKEPLNDQDIAMGLFGLQNFTAQSFEVQKLLSTIIPAIDRSTCVMSAQSISMSFYGIQSMSTTKETVLLLNALAKKLTDVCNQPDFDVNPKYALSSSQVGRMFFGLRNKLMEESTGVNATESILSILKSMTKLTKRSNVELNAFSLANAFWGLQHFDTKYEEVREALGCLAHKLVLSSQPFTGLDYGMILYALRKMDSDLPEVRVIYGTLLYRMKMSPMTLQLQEMSMMIMGILKTTEWIREDFMKVIASAMPPPSAASSTLSENNVEDHNSEL